MSMHGSFIMIQGNHMPSLPEVFSRFKYVPISPPKQINGWKETYKVVHDPIISGKSNTIVYKAACYINNWTIIYDAEGLMVSDEAFCPSISSWLNARVVGVICEGTSNTYAYINCDGNSTRSFWISDGEIFKDSGEKFPEEPVTRNLSGKHCSDTKKGHCKVDSFLKVEYSMA